MADLYMVGTDGSDGSKRAVQFAVDLAKKTGAKLLLAHVIEWSRFEFMMSPDLEQRHALREKEISRAKNKVLLPAEQTAGDLATESVVHHGHAAQGLADLATEHEVSQIIIGRQGHSNLSDFLHGSVAGNLARISPVPVTVVP